MVLVLSTVAPQSQWSLVQTCIGSDDRVRVVNVQVGLKEFTHSVHKLVPLEFHVELIHHRLIKDGRNVKEKI